MTVNQKVVVVTGGGSGIGRALCRRCAAEGARSVAVVDVNRAAAEAVAREIGGLAIGGADVSDEATMQRVVAEVLHHRSRIDLFCSNAGVAVDGDEQTPTAEWDRCWGVNVMAHVYAARAVLPHMLARGDGYLLQTVSAAGLLTHIQSATYAVTKHASLAFAEWLSIVYGDRGIKVSAICPQGVRTEMLKRAAAGGRTFLLDTAIEPEQVADAVIKGLADERFLILPHADVAEYFRRKANDYDRWLRGMRKLRAANP
jgi:NAD(P)-dependent dehydrogenase (short-subunit alcohol dehydrogenase family)